MAQNASKIDDISPLCSRKRRMYSIDDSDFQIFLNFYNFKLLTYETRQLQRKDPLSNTH